MFHSSLTAVLGPTNTGKTHLAIDRMLAHPTGMMGFPLRLLAREVYDRVVALKGPERVALITGEEKILPPYADYFLCTVESMPLEREVAFLAIDEVQMAADPDRGHIFTNRLLHARGREETMLLGAETIRPLIRSLLGDAAHVTRPRFSSLSVTPPRKLSRLPRRSAVVAFSAEAVYGLAEILRRQKGGAAIVMGALSPRTRNAQVELFQSGDVDYLVATDAIGMGLNMDIDHVAFASLKKFDGRRMRALTPAEMGQIAGRAGRHMSDGTFGVISGLENGAAHFTDDSIERIENHRFEALDKLYWRAAELDFANIEALLASLEAAPSRAEFARAPAATDLLVLKMLAGRPEIAARARGEPLVRRLWQSCQIPDFRKISLEQHARLVARIFSFLSRKEGILPGEWIAGQVRRLDNVQGDIDTLAARIAGIRIWTFISHRRGWLERPDYWAEEARRVEDRLSDALHDRLTQRFVDRRTSVLLRQLRQKGEWMVDVEKATEGEEDVWIEGQHIGRLSGFHFLVDPAAAHQEHRNLRNVAEKALRTKLAERAATLATASNDAFRLSFKAGLARPRILWGDMVVAHVVAGPDQSSPRAHLAPGHLLDGDEAHGVITRLNDWLNHQFDVILEPVARMRDTLKIQAQGKAEVALRGTERGVMFRLIEKLGVLPRYVVEAEVRALEQPARRLLRQFGIRFGAHFLFMPALLKPRPTDWRLMLWALQQEDGAHIPEAPEPGRVWIEVESKAPRDFYRVAGYEIVGDKAVRIDMFERLADTVRPLGQEARVFPVTPEIMGLVGLSGADFVAVMRALGYVEAPLPEGARPADGPENVEGAAQEPPKPVPLSFRWQPRRKRPGPGSHGTKPQRKAAGRKRSGADKTVAQENAASAATHSPFAVLAKLKEGSAD